MNPTFFKNQNHIEKISLQCGKFTTSYRTLNEVKLSLSRIKFSSEWRRSSTPNRTGFDPMPSELFGVALLLEPPSHPRKDSTFCDETLRTHVRNKTILICWASYWRLSPKEGGRIRRTKLGRKRRFPESGTRDVSKGEMIHFFRWRVSRCFPAFAPKTGLSNDLDNVSQSVSFHTMSVLFLPPFWLSLCWKSVMF